MYIVPAMYHEDNDEEIDSLTRKYKNNRAGIDKVVSTIDKKFAQNAINEIKKKARLELQKGVKPVISYLVLNGF